MTKIKFDKPDYKHWAALDTWGINSFALLLNGICPEKYRAVRLAYTETPTGFEKAKKTFTLLDSIPWAMRYEKLYIRGKGGHPAIFMHEAINKNLHIPAPLRKAIEERYQRIRPTLPSLENQEQPITHVVEGATLEQPLANRERKSYAKGVGLLVLIIKELKEKISRNAEIKLSALQVSQMLIEKAEILGLDSSGLKSFDRKITEAIALINQEANSEINL